ncbi:hypothetical protein ACJQWK_07396 [Exserohilum turcicum]
MHWPSWAVLHIRKIAWAFGIGVSRHYWLQFRLINIVYHHYLAASAFLRDDSHDNSNNNSNNNDNSNTHHVDEDGDDDCLAGSRLSHDASDPLPWNPGPWMDAAASRS